MHRREFIGLSALGILGLSSSFSLIQSEYSKEDLMGKSTPTLYGNGYNLRADAHTAFLKMKEAAAIDKIDIKVVSSYRNYAHQNRIWERKYRKFTSDGTSPIKAIEKIIEYSTIPGTSRHHWGTDIDIVDAVPKQPKGLLLEKNFHANGPFCKLKEWLDKNANEFGFFMSYTDNPKRKGFKYEPWHYSYAPLSIPMLKAYQKLDIKIELQQADLLGIKYFDTAFIQKYIEDNILDINPALL